MQRYFYNARDLRDACEMGIQEASRIIQGEQLRLDIRRAQNIDDLKAVLETIVNEKWPAVPDGFTYVGSV